jgi:ABC-type transport system involved in multi-copper enzyme maturation permease subunit
VNFLRTFATLLRFSFRRLLWSVNTLMVLFPVTGCGLFVLRRGFHKITSPELAFDAFGTFLVFIFSSFLIPICVLGFATTALGAEREEQTLVFLLTRPIQRWVVLLAKIFASIPLSFGLVLGTFAIYCQLAGPVGNQAFQIYWPAMIGMTAAYLALFHLFAVAFRHPTMLALVYALFMELFVANLPGTIKRLAINYYGRSLLYGLGADYGLKTPRGFEIIPEPQAYGMLAGITLTCLFVAFLIFQWKEYRDLT